MIVPPLLRQCIYRLQNHFNLLASFTHDSLEASDLLLIGTKAIDAEMTLISCVSLGLLALAVYLLRPKTQSMLPEVYISGLDDGKRSLKQAREHFVTNCSDMMLEGYQKVVAAW